MFRFDFQHEDADDEASLAGDDLTISCDARGTTPTTGPADHPPAHSTVTSSHAPHSQTPGHVARPPLSARRGWSHSIDLAQSTFPSAQTNGTLDGEKQERAHETRKPTRSVKQTQLPTYLPSLAAHTFAVPSPRHTIPSSSKTETQLRREQTLDTISHPPSPQEQGQDRTDKTILLLRTCLALAIQVFGSEHPNVFSSSATLYRWTQDYRLPDS